NLTDGLDGLALGLIIFVVSAYAGLSYLTGHIKIAEYLKIPFIHDSAELTVYCMSVLGAGIGFLWYNAHPAEVFMGDTGSLSLGGAIGVISLLIKKEILLIIVGGVFVAETFSVILQVFSYKLFGKRVFLMAPIHHHFELKGWSESKIIVRFWIIGAMLALIAMSTLKIQ
ncbi:phospho-N-acetylmuramoyl-pentapeptide-transferase, partial [Candidatus Aerophobetes bacterium]